MLIYQCYYIGIANYDERSPVDDSFSRTAHEKLFNDFHHGQKVEITDNIVSFLDFSERWLN